MAILDWEFAGLGDPMEDLGWFCAAAGASRDRTLDAGGLGSREASCAATRPQAVRTSMPRRCLVGGLRARVRWAVIALQQGMRHASGVERSLSLALTGRLADALELHLLDATLPYPAGRSPMSGDARETPVESGNPAVRVVSAGMPADAQALLDAAREALEAMAGETQGDDRIALLMSAAAVATVARETDCTEASHALRRDLLDASGMRTMRELARAVRDGRLDDIAAVESALLRETALRAWVTRPHELDAALRERLGLHSGTGPPVLIQ